MKNEKNKVDTPEETKPYQPRPAWQVWGARIGLVLMVIIIILSYIRIASGKM